MTTALAINDRGHRFAADRFMYASNLDPNSLSQTIVKFYAGFVEQFNCDCKGLTTRVAGPSA